MEYLAYLAMFAFVVLVSSWPDVFEYVQDKKEAKRNPDADKHEAFQRGVETLSVIYSYNNSFDADDPHQYTIRIRSESGEWDMTLYGKKQKTPQKALRRAKRFAHRKINERGRTLAAERWVNNNRVVKEEVRVKQ